MANKAVDLINQAGVIVKNKTANVPAAKRAFLAGVLLVHAIAHIVEALSRDGTDAERAELATAAKQAWHDNVSVIDIPAVPDYMEAFFDNALETAIASGIDFGMNYLAEVRAEIDALLKAPETPAT